MKIYKFLQHDEWPVLIMAKTEAKEQWKAEKGELQ
jgi:hypothetical protein